MQLFKVIGNGEVHEIKSDSPIKGLLEENEVYILNDDELRIVYLWKGAESTVRSKFIGANKLQEVRGQVGLNYKTTSMDSDEAKDYPDFLASIEKPTSKGFAKEIKEDMDLKFDVGGSVQTRVATLGGAGQKFNETIQQSGPIYTGGKDAAVSGGFGGASAAKTPSKEDLDKILEVVDKEGMPDGFEREMIILGDHAYSVAEKVQTFLGKKQVEKVLEPISSLPEGVFFADGYVPRVLVQNQSIVAVEFLKKKE
jgi:hypothetical protein